MSILIRNNDSRVFEIRIEPVKRLSVLLFAASILIFGAEKSIASVTEENKVVIGLTAHLNNALTFNEKTLPANTSLFLLQSPIPDTTVAVQPPDTLIGPPASPVDEQEQGTIGQNGDLELAGNDEDTTLVNADTVRQVINGEDAATDPDIEASADSDAESDADTAGQDINGDGTATYPDNGASADAESDAETSEVSEVISDIESGLLTDVQAIISFRKIFLSILVLLSIYFLLRFLTALVDNLSERSTSNRLIFKRVIPVLKITFWTLGIYFVVAGIIAPPIETIITVSASIGIAIGFASQDILRNVFGGIMIILDRPFQVGDKIDIGGQYGEVIEIGLRSVRIVTPDDSVVSLPNGELMNKAVSNANTSALDCQVVAEIYLPANVNIQEVRELAYRAAATSRYVYLNKPIVVNAINEIHYDRFIVKLRVKAYVLDIRYEFRFKSDMTELILRELSKREILASEVPEELPAQRKNEK